MSSCAYDYDDNIEMDIEYKNVHNIVLKCKIIQTRKKL